MARGITVRRLEEQGVDIPHLGRAFRVKIVAFDNELMPAEIFLHQKRLVDPYTSQQGSDFIAVCCPQDLVEFPVNEPAVTQQPAFYRLDTIDVIVASRAQALEMWEAVRSRVCVLVDALNRKDELEVKEDYRCGDALPTDESASVSSSASSS